MEAPDKIYLQENTTTDCYGELWPEWFEGTHHPDRDICYIRKDALLEWAKEKDLSSVLHHPDRHYILVELIEKIESL